MLFLATALHAAPTGTPSGSAVAAVVDRGQPAVAAPASSGSVAASVSESPTPAVAGNATATVSTSAAAVVRPAPENRMRRMSEQDILKRFDQNGDGKLDEDEVAAAHDEMMKGQLERRAERKEDKKAGLPAGEKLRQVLLEKFDRNHDGQLDEAERAEARKYVEEHGLGERMRAAGQAMREQLLARFDKDGDGQLDEAEWAEAAPVLRQRIEAAPGMMRRFDKNGDGKLDDNEWAAASTQLQRMINHPRPARAAGKK